MVLCLTDKLPAAMKSGATNQRNCYTTVPNHAGDMPEGTLRAIFRQAGIESEDFLRK
jgi:hypothetical protein